MKAKIKAFEQQVNASLNRALDSLDEIRISKMNDIDNLKFVSFTNEKPYIGETENMVFYTYSDCYRGNSPLNVSINRLHHPHTGYQDRGYIKGVAVDLKNWDKIRRLTITVPHMHLPNLTVRASKHSETYINQVSAILGNAEAQLENAVKEANENLNTQLKTLTGCTLLYYPQNT